MGAQGGMAGGTGGADIWDTAELTSLASGRHLRLRELTLRLGSGARNKSRDCHSYCHHRHKGLPIPTEREKGKLAAAADLACHQQGRR